eukprot:6038204-Alexandrium_andersonii.AAC.1
MKCFWGLSPSPPLFRRCLPRGCSRRLAEPPEWGCLQRIFLRRRRASEQSLEASRGAASGT